MPHALDTHSRSHNQHATSSQLPQAQPHSNPHHSLSPLRKAMSLTALFRHSVDARSQSHSKAGTSSQILISSPQIQVTECRSTSPIPSLSMTTPPPTLEPLKEPLKRMKRRLSLRSPTLSPSTTSAASAATPILGTPSSVASVSTLGSTPSSTFRRPRSGSCRASILHGSGSSGGIISGRVLPFTLPRLDSMEDESNEDLTPKGNKIYTSQHRPLSISAANSAAPRRPLTPAPLLMLDEGMNSLGISTGVPPSATWHVVSPRSSMHAQPATNGLGLSTSATTNAQQLPVPVQAWQRLLSINGSRESFQCRGEDEENRPPGWRDTAAVAAPPSATGMTRSVSAQAAATSNAKDKESIVPGSPLMHRRRPWALSLQLQSSAASAVVAAGAQSAGSTWTTKAASRSTAIQESVIESRRESVRSIAMNSLDPRSHFSSSNSSMYSNDIAQDGAYNDEAAMEYGSEVDEEELFSASSDASPASTWTSSAFSFDTTPESPDSQFTQRFSTPSVPRRRSNTVSTIPVMSTRHSVENTGTIKAPLTMRGRAPAATMATHASAPLLQQDIPAICPASPPTHVRLRLTLPPTAIAKHGGASHEEVMEVSMSASTLELKEAICTSLHSRYRLSISPSQLGLFVIDVLKSPVQRVGSPLECGTPFAQTSNRPDSPTGGAQQQDPISPSSAYGFLRPRSRLRQSFAQQRHEQQPRSSFGLMRQGQSQSSLSPKPFGSRQLFRQLDNDIPLYQEGLQDDDAVIVRF